ncbi:MAG: T9SS type A sorting domain-containing protein [Candidatus Latescibacteria bacterium]|nr:T9SS type A sorting domain-containing protein [Candidatus Latescibacterota bacterium]
MKTIKVVLGLLLYITFIWSNPVFVSFINEIQTLPLSEQRIEIHNTPAFGGSTDLSGYWIKTRAGIANINPGIVLQYNGFVTIDSTNTTGIFYINPDADTVEIYTNYDWLIQSVIFPGQPVGWNKAPAPPYGGSISLYRSPYYSNMYWDRINWYIDSTPTFNATNDNWSSISGSVYNLQGQPIAGLFIEAKGLDGVMCGLSDSIGHFHIPGLGFGKYWLTVWTHNNVLIGNYPDSVYLGYSEHISITIYLPYGGIEQNPNVTLDNSSVLIPNPFRQNSLISLALPYANTVSVRIYDSKGSLVTRLLEQKLGAGRHQVGLNKRLMPGVYFLDIKTDHETLTKKLILIN